MELKKQLMNPVFFYIVASAAIFIYHITQVSNQYCITDVQCFLLNPLFLAFIKLIYILGNVFILNVLYQGKYIKIGWFVAILAIIAWMFYYEFISNKISIIEGHDHHGLPLTTS